LADPAKTPDARINVTWPITSLQVRARSRRIKEYHAQRTFHPLQKQAPGGRGLPDHHQLPNEKQIIVKGQMMWSNLNGRQDTGVFVNMGFSFIRMSDEDQEVLRSVISLFGEGGIRNPSTAKANGRPKKALLQALPEWARSTSFLKRSSQAKVRTGVERYLRHKE